MEGKGGRLYRVRLQLHADGVPKETPNPLRSGIHHRGYLPHVKREGASYFVTFRLADSLPREVLGQLHRQRAERLQALAAARQHAPPGNSPRHVRDSTEEIEREYLRAVEGYLDKGAGACHLRKPEVAEMICKALRHFHQEQYVLDDWVVMPNHVHLILWPMPSFTLSEILKSRKQYTSTQAHRILALAGGAFWQPESFDHWIRDEDEKARIRRYIRFNPVKAGLCERPEDWRWSSAWRDSQSP